MTKPSLTVLVNREGGAAASAGDALPHTLSVVFESAGIEADVRLLAASDMPAAIEKASASDRRIVVAGGDGTAACAAQALVGSETELALLPLGTLNHLARDLGIPADLDKAASLAANGEPISIDVGEVNGHRFINNASIGIYPSMVRERDAVRKRHGWPKWLASVPASWAVLSRLHHHRLRIDTGQGEQPLVTPLLFVGNNSYSLAAGSIGSRASLQAGKLSVYVVAGGTRLALIWFAIRVALGKVELRTDFIALGDCQTITVRAPGGSVDRARWRSAAAGLSAHVQDACRRAADRGATGRVHHALISLRSLRALTP